MTKSETMVLQAIRYIPSPPSLQILNQLLLPHQTVYDTLHTAEDGWHAIKSMRTRGAPAIAIVAALSLAVELQTTTISDKAEETAAFILEKLEYLVTSRPTAVNLGDAARKLEKITSSAAAKQGANGQAVRTAYVDAAAQMLIADVADNKGIGGHGADWIVKHSPPSVSNHGDDGRISILTHCNTGSLATAGYGTALGVIRSLHAQSALRRAYCTETRPYNQGSRLTAYELVHDGIPATLITDSMASALLQMKGGPERFGAVVVGADRVAANGDTANKIGTYQLAITAKYHGIPFLVAAPRTTIDLSTRNGSAITIEERPGEEVTRIKGPRFDGVDVDVSGPTETVSIAAHGIDVWNPAFDVTPASLISGIVTEVGVVEKGEDGKFDLTMAMEAHNEGIKPKSVGGL